MSGKGVSLHGCLYLRREDADTEALELDRHKRVLADGGEDAYAETWGLLFDAGGDARANRVPFDEGRTCSGVGVSVAR
jgi:hypothetical protein